MLAEAVVQHSLGNHSKNKNYYNEMLIAAVLHTYKDGKLANC